MIGEAVLVFVVLIGLLVVVIIFLTRWLSARFSEQIAERHEDLYWIQDTGLPPKRWIDQLSGPLTTGEQARAGCIKKLTALTGYVQETRLVESEETRIEVTNQLKAVREAWQALPVKAFLPAQPGDETES